MFFWSESDFELLQLIIWRFVQPYFFLERATVGASQMHRWPPRRDTLEMSPLNHLLKGILNNIKDAVKRAKISHEIKIGPVYFYTSFWSCWERFIGARYS